MKAWDYILGAIMIDENNYRCTTCDENGKFRQGDTITVHMKRTKHI